jgi:hypothetical protein
MMFEKTMLPKSIQCLQDYSLTKFIADLIAGITVGLVALPLTMAFAISSGVLPQSGLYCGILAGFLISAIGGSRCQVGGPTGAFVVVIAGIVAKYGMNGLLLCTLMAGVIIALLGITGLGSAVKFIPRPVIVGFTNGIAMLIASTQIKDFFGLNIAHQYRLSIVWRFARNGSDCKDGDQHPFRSADASCRDDTRACFAGNSTVCGATCTIHPTCGSGGDSFRRRLQYGRMERNPPITEVALDGSRCMGNHLRVDGLCRFDSRGYGGHDSGGAPLYT